MEIIFFDCETTGVDPVKDRIVQISLIKTDSELNILDRRKTLVNPGISIPKEATAVHGITDEMVKEAPLFSSLAKPLYSYMVGKIVGGYNIKSFDVPLIIEEFGHCGIDYIPSGIVDSFFIFREKEKRDLSAALKFYCGQVMENAHDAEADVLATIQVLKGQLFHYEMDTSSSINFCIHPDDVDFEGKIRLIEGAPCFTFGKHNGHKVEEVYRKDYSYIDWFLRGGFGRNSKNVLRSLIENFKKNG